MSPKDRADAPSSSGESSSSHPDDGPHARPGYMTVGSGSTPEAAARLISMLDQDSGYGGSLVDGDSSGRSYPNIVEDRPSASPTSILPASAGSAEQDRQRSHVLQLRYNQNKNALARSIHGTIDALKSFQEYNMKWPAHYPSVPPEPKHPRPDLRPGLQHTQSALGDFEPQVRSPDRPRPPRQESPALQL
jgi:hypothetical protein